VERIRPREALKIVDQSQGSGRGMLIRVREVGGGATLGQWEMDQEGLFQVQCTVLNKVEVYFLCFF